MGLNIFTLGSSKTYTRESLLGGGAVVGKNVTISSITPIEGGNKVTFSYTLDDGTVKTSSMNVMDGKDGIDGTNGKNGKDGQPGKDGSDGVGISKIEKISTVDLVDTYRITFTDNSTFDYEVKNGKDGQGGGTADVPIEKIKVNGELQTPVNKVVDITVPSIDGLAKTEDIPTKVSELTNDSGYLTEHQDISGKVDKVDGKSLIADTEIERLASVDNYNDTQIKTQIQAVANGLMDSVGYSADYKSIDIIAKNGVKKSVNVAPIISHASITELSDVDTTNKATGKALVYNATTSKHEYADVSGTDEKVKMDASTDAKYLGELLDNVTIANENGKLKVKKLDGQEVTITEINYLKGLTMNVMDLVNMFSNGGVKIINTPVATYAELLTLDKSSFIEGVSYLVYVLADENHDNAKTTYLVDKDSETPTYFGFADSQRDFTTNPIDLATEITGKLGISNMDSDAIKALFTVDDTYKTETATNNAFSTHGAKALYDELLLAIGNKANSSDLTAHKDDADIHVSTEDRTKWNSAKTHADSAHAPSNAQENVLETVKVNGTALEVSDKAVNVTVPTKVSELTDSADYAKKTDIPTTLPADGGNADTVNNHTVETDVPTDAKFTDTVYDDTEVKGSIEGLSSNLDALEYSDIAGGKNLLKWNTNKTITYNGVTFDATKNGKLKLSGTSSNPLLVTGFMECTFTLPQGTYTISSSAGGNTFNLYAIDGSTELLKTLNGTFTLSKETEIYLGKWTASGTDMNYDIDLQIEEGSTATPYEPYIPSVKMLADKVNAQQSIEAMDLKMLGWNVPSEFPIQNEVSGNQFIQKVGRVDLGELAWSYTTNPNRFLYYLANIKSCDVMSIANVIVTDKLSVTTFDNVYSHASDNILGVSGRNVGVYASSYTDVESFKNAMKGVYLYYDLATPITKTIDGNEAVEELSSNLSQLEFGEVAAGKNLFKGDFIKKVLDTGINYTDIDLSKEQNTIKDIKGIVFAVFGAYLKKGTYTFSYTNDAYFSLNRIAIAGTDCILAIESIRKSYTWTQNTDGWTYFGIEGDDSETGVTDTPFSITPNIQIEKGTQATEYEPYIPSVKMIAEEVNQQNESLSVIGKCKNLLKPTLQTTTNNGVTCTNNGDGTYTLNGTNNADSSIWFVITDYLTLEPNEKYKLVGAYPNSNRPFEDNNTLWFLELDKNQKESIFNTRDFGDGRVFTATETTVDAEICIKKGATLNNFTFKPMLTTNLNATYDDFVPYTGDGETLTHDVAELKNDLGGLSFSASGTTLTITDGTNTWTLGANS